MVPDCQNVYRYAPNQHAFHQHLVAAARRFSAENDLTYHQIKTMLPPTVKYMYGYGAASLSPYGYYHPMCLLTNNFKQFSRGKLLKQPKLMKHPLFTYSYDADDHPTQVECHWVNGQTSSITLILWNDYFSVPLMLTYHHQVDTESYVLTMIAWGEKHGETEYRFQVGSMHPTSSSAVTTCNTEMLHSLTVPLLQSRYEFLIFPDGREYLTCYSS